MNLPAPRAPQALSWALKPADFRAGDHFGHPRLQPRLPRACLQPVLHQAGGTGTPLDTSLSPSPAGCAGRASLGVLLPRFVHLLNPEPFWLSCSRAWGASQEPSFPLAANEQHAEVAPGAATSPFGTGCWHPSCVVLWPLQGAGAGL